MKAKPLNILLIEDDGIDSKAIVRQLSAPALAHHITVVSCGESGLNKIRSNHYDVVLLDYRLANMTAVEILLIMNSENLLTMPVIVLSIIDDESLMLKCLEHGAQDYLLKSEVSPKILLRAMRYAGERKALQQQLVRMAKFDSLTGLANRELFVNGLQDAIAKAKRRNGLFAVLFIDLDHFKIINDTLGHAIGDELLISVGERLKVAVRDEDVVARLGGDEFAILLEDIKGGNNAARIAEKVLSELEPEHHCDQHIVNISPSIGIAIYPECGADVESLMQAADAAMYEAKNSGRNNFQFFSTQMKQLVASRLSIEDGLHQAMVSNELTLHYQPQVDAKTQQVVATEALLRWHHPEFGNVLPEAFIPIAEDIGLINAIGAWVLLTSGQQQATWSNNGKITMPLSLAVNISMIQLKSAKFVDQLFLLLSQIAIRPEQLVLEVTEATLLSNPDEMAKTLIRIKGLGVGLCIDDFGTGYSSLAYLAKLPLDSLKIDLSFVAGIGSDKKAEGVVLSIISLAHHLGLKVIAEGVENQQQMDFLVNNQCDILQGYYLSHPVAAAELTGCLQNGFQKSR